MFNYPPKVVDASAVKFTPEGGLAVKYVNGTGAPSVKGDVVGPSTAADGRFILETNEFDAVGVVYESGIADGSPCWVVISGQADVLLEDGTASTRGNIAVSSDVDGRADCTIANPGSGLPAVETHFKEIGHCLQSVAAGTGKLCRIMLHFN